MTDQLTSSTPTQNDKIMAALAHVSALLPMMGVIAPIIIWAIQKDKYWRRDIHPLWNCWRYYDISG